MTRSTTTSTAAPQAPSAQAGRLRALAGEQLARDRWSRERLLAYQGERLRALIAHAVAASPYYRAVLGPDAASGEVPLEELPTLPKATLMDNLDRIVTDPRLRRADLQAHLAGLRDAGAVPPPIEVTPVPEIGRDPGYGAKFKLVRSVVPRG
jgi:hypothetical protein